MKKRFLIRYTECPEKKYPF